MTPSYADRLAHNEAVFREINERIEASSEFDGERAPVAFRCECAVLGCNQLVELSLGEYKAVRSDPRWFLMVPGHELADIEVVVARHPGYVVVEKYGRAGRVAQDTDPRDD